jgi:5-methylcytosine-specific restriction endonuclease McrA
MSLIRGRDVADALVERGMTERDLAVVLGWTRTARRRKRRVDGTLGQPFTVTWADIGRVQQMLGRGRLNEATVEELHRVIGLRAPNGKVCTKCGQRRALTYFNRARRGLLGRVAVCRPCRTRVARRAYHADLPRSREKVRREQRRRRGRPDDPALTDAYVEIILADPCAYCGAVPDSIDHVTPTSGGGTSDWFNLTPSCRPCNTRKGRQPLLLALLKGGARRTP